MIFFPFFYKFIVCRADSGHDLIIIESPGKVQAEALEKKITPFYLWCSCIEGKLLFHINKITNVLKI